MEVQEQENKVLNSWQKKQEDYMDAKTFLNDCLRMCDSFYNCIGCPLELVLQSDCFVKEIDSEEIDLYIDQVNKWSKEHPDPDKFYEKVTILEIVLSTHKELKKEDIIGKICPSKFFVVDKPVMCSHTMEECEHCWSQFRYRKRRKY